MNKRKVNHYWNKVKGVRTWQLILLAIFFAWLSVYSLRQNSLNLDPKIQAVITADKEGSGIEESINELGDYVMHHMNADLPRPIQLENSYSRAVDKAYDDALKSLHSGPLLEEAKRVCAQLGVIVSAGPQCIQDYLDKNWNPDKGSLVVDFPDPVLFTYQFVSPSWSPDIAGWSIFITVILIILIISRMITQIVVRRILKSHQ